MYFVWCVLLFFFKWFVRYSNEVIASFSEMTGDKWNVHFSHQTICTIAHDRMRFIINFKRSGFSRFIEICMAKQMPHSQQSTTYVCVCVVCKMLSQFMCISLIIVKTLWQLKSSKWTEWKHHFSLLFSLSIPLPLPLWNSHWLFLFLFRSGGNKHHFWLRFGNR